MKKKNNITKEKDNQTYEAKAESLDGNDKSLITKKPKLLKKLRIIIIYIISLLVMAFSFVQIIRLHNQKLKTLEMTAFVKDYITIDKSVDYDNIPNNENDIGTENIEKYTIDFKGLKSINPDTKGWIRLDSIGIDFPVVQTTNNEYYLKHSFDKSYNVAGWAFADYRNKLDGSDKNIIIYGHNRKDDTMFSKMPKILESEWYNDENNKYITFFTENGEEKYEIFSIYQIEVEDYYIKTNFNSDSDYQRFLNTIKSRSTKDYNINLTTEDKILTLSTCGKENKYRIVLHAKKI